MTEHPTNPYGGNEPSRFDDPPPAATGASPAPATRTSPPTPIYPTGDGPTGDRPVGDRPVGDRPVGDGPYGGAPYGGGPAGGGPVGHQSDSGPAGTAKHEARRVADTAASAGAGVAQTAKDQAAEVAAETKHQAASLLDTVRSEVGQQAGTQQQRIAEAVHSLSKELGSMASNSPESGWVTDLVHEASRRGGEVAHWLQDREPADVLEAVRSYARRRPGTFLVLCGLAGVVAGRLTRSAVASRTSLDSPDDNDSRALTDRGSGQGYPAPAIESTAAPRASATPVASSTGTIATETSTLTEPTAVGARDPLAPGGDPTR